LVFLLLDDELVEISSCAKLHDDIEFLPLDNGLAIGDDIDVLEGLQQLDLNEDIFSLFSGLIGQLHFLYHVVFLLLDLTGEIGVPERSELIQLYPCPIIFKILYCSIIIVIISV
jgi:hypothetical protein